MKSDAATTMPPKSNKQIRKQNKKQPQEKKKEKKPDQNPQDPSTGRIDRSDVTTDSPTSELAEGGRRNKSGSLKPSRSVRDGDEDASVNEQEGDEEQEEVKDDWEAETDVDGERGVGGREISCSIIDSDSDDESLGNESDDTSRATAKPDGADSKGGAATGAARLGGDESDAKSVADEFRDEVKARLFGHNLAAGDAKSGSDDTKKVEQQRGNDAAGQPYPSPISATASSASVDNPAGAASLKAKDGLSTRRLENARHDVPSALGATATKVKSSSCRGGVDQGEGCSSGKGRDVGRGVKNKADFVRHPHYWLIGGDLYIRIDSVIFKVHSYWFRREARTFFTRSNGAADPTSPGDDLRGSTETTPIVINSATVEEFEMLLWVFYNPLYDTYDADLPSFLTILRLAHEWGFPSVGRFALREIHARFQHNNIPLVQKIAMYRDHGAPKAHLVPLYAELCARAAQPSDAEVKVVGWEAAVGVFRVRERIRSAAFVEAVGGVKGKGKGDGNKFDSEVRVESRDRRGDGGEWDSPLPDGVLDRHIWPIVQSVLGLPVYTPDDNLNDVPKIRTPTTPTKNKSGRTSVSPRQVEREKEREVERASAREKEKLERENQRELKALKEKKVKEEQDNERDKRQRERDSATQKEKERQMERERTKQEEYARAKRQEKEKELKGEKASAASSFAPAPLMSSFWNTTFGKK